MPTGTQRTNGLRQMALDAFHFIENYHVNQPIAAVPQNDKKDHHGHECGANYKGFAEAEIIIIAVASGLYRRRW